MTDLFDKRSDKDRLYDFIKSRSPVKTSDVIAWGGRNHSNRAERNARLLATEGKIQRMDSCKKMRYFGSIGQDVWEVV